MKSLTGLALGALVLGALSLSSPAQAQGMGKLMDEVKSKVSNPAHAKAIYERRTAMRMIGGNMKIIAGYAKAGKGTPADVAAAANKIAGLAASVPGLFPAGTDVTAYLGTTRAKPEIWSDMAGYKKSAGDLENAARDLAKVASAAGADQKSVGMALGAVGKTCGTCHKAYRAPKAK